MCSLYKHHTSSFMYPFSQYNSTQNNKVYRNTTTYIIIHTGYHIYTAETIIELSLLLDTVLVTHSIPYKSTDTSN